MVMSVYRPPNTRHDTFIEALTCIQGILANIPSPDTEVIVTGDFTFSHINWESLEVNGGTAEDKQ